MKTYPINHISRLRMGSDGKGICTLIIVADCTLRCRYCINSFTWDNSKEPKLFTTEQLYNEIIIDRPYMLATNGGVTFGGGEPLMYPELICEFRDICERDISICVETALNVSTEACLRVTEAVEHFYIDIKTLNRYKYNQYTAGNLDIVVENLKQLIQAKGTDAITVRIPIIPGLTDRDEQNEYKQELMKMGVKKFDLFRYRID